MIIGLGITQQVGKDTIGQHLVEKHGFTRLSFADAVRDLALEIDPLIGGARLSDRVGWEGWEQAKKSSEIRRLLINIGVGARKVLGFNVWVNAAEQKLRELQLDPEFNGKVVVTDVRFPNEATWIQSFIDHALWYVWRPDSPPQDEKSELLTVHDFSRSVNSRYRSISNAGTIDDLKQKVDDILADYDDQ